MTQTAAAKPAIKSTNLWTGVATIVSAAFAFFSIVPNVNDAAILAEGAQNGIQAISTKNYALLFAVVVNVANVLLHLFKTK